MSLNPGFPAAAVAFSRQAIADETQRRQLEAASKRDESSNAPPADLKPLKQMLRQAGARDPMNSTVFNLIGQIAALENDKKIERQMMSLATKLSRREPEATDFMMRQSLLENNASAALYYADIFMRGHTSALGYVAPIVARMTEFPVARNELIKRLGAAPPWRNQVLGSFASSGLTNPRAPLELLIALKDSPHPLTETEVAGYINYLIQKKLYAAAYSSWLRFLPRDQLNRVERLFNGSFERQPSGIPFDWTIGAGSGTIAGIYRRPDASAQSALMISFGQGRATLPGIQETIILYPGAYRFEGNVTGEILSRRGLQWRVTCVDGASVGESPMLIGRFPKWTSFGFDISIPAEKCPAQRVELIHMARSPSEQFASGSVWFDDLAIRRSDGVSVSSP